MRRQLEQSFSEGTALKTWVLEVHPDQEPRAFLHEMVRGNGSVEPTEDAYLQLVRFRAPHVEFLVDHLEDRFWSFHTRDRVSDARPLLRGLVTTRRDVDWTWLATGHLESLLAQGRPLGAGTDFRGERFLPDEPEASRLQLRIGGSRIDQLLSSVRKDPAWVRALALDRVAVCIEDEDFGHVKEAVSREGCFAAAGDSLSLHQEFVRLAVGTYRRLVEAIEQRMLSWSGNPDSGRELSGSAMVIHFSQPLADLDLFVDSLFSSREPFRLWGVPQDGPGGMKYVEAVDLHVGHRLRMELSKSWIRLLLDKGCCGNTVARLASNLQHRVDANIRFEDPELQALLAPRAA